MLAACWRLHDIAFNSCEIITRSDTSSNTHCRAVKHCGDISGIASTWRSEVRRRYAGELPFGSAMNESHISMINAVSICALSRLRMAQHRRETDMYEMVAEVAIRDIFDADIGGSDFHFAFDLLKRLHFDRQYWLKLSIGCVIASNMKSLARASAVAGAENILHHYA